MSVLLLVLLNGQNGTSVTVCIFRKCDHRSLQMPFKKSIQ